MAELRRRIGDETSLEAVLDQIVADEGDTSRELVAFRFYLQSLLGRSSDAGVTALGGVTNHALLVRRIERWRRKAQPDSPVIYVTFNYDTILDQAIASEYQWTKGSGVASLDDFITKPQFRLIKLHGSVSWGHPTSVPSPWGDLIQAYGRDQNLPHRAKALLLDAAYQGSLEIVNNSFEVMPSFGSLPSDWATKPAPQVLVIPALAVPLQNKATYLCPAGHVDEMRRLMPMVDRILTIGWKAGEPDFVGELSATKPGALLMAVNGRPQSRLDVAGSLRAAGAKVRPVDDDGSRVEGAFSKLVEGRDQLEAFLDLEAR